MPQILYSGDGNGNWIRREWAERCLSCVPVYRQQCFGVKDHVGAHWRFKKDGTLCIWDASGSHEVPPDHPDYLNQEGHAKSHFMQNFCDTVIVDPVTINMLEGGKTPEPDAGWSCPYSRGSLGENQ